MSRINIPRLDKLINLDSIGVTYACVFPSQSKEYSDDNINIVIPLQHTALQPKRKTAIKQKNGGALVKITFPLFQLLCHTQLTGNSNQK